MALIAVGAGLARFTRLYGTVARARNGSVGPWSNLAGRGLRRAQTADLCTLRSFATSARPSRHGPTGPLRSGVVSRSHGARRLLFRGSQGMS